MDLDSVSVGTSREGSIPLIKTQNIPKSQNVFVSGNFRIDYVLVYDKPSKHLKTYMTKLERQNYYESSLKRKGLLLEKYEHENQTFVKIHAPTEVLKRYCEILKIRMPVKESIAKVLKPNMENRNFDGCFNRIKLVIGHIINFFGMDTTWIPETDYKITAEYSQHRGCLFDDEYTELFFPTSYRCMIVNFILEQVKYSTNAHHVGLTKLLEHGVYADAYPPHEGSIVDNTQERGMLVKNWSSLKNIFSYQPIDEIKDYFGMKFALYFAFAGFYTYMLVPASILGIFSVLYGVFSQEQNILGIEICDENQTMIMCPPCDKYCDYYNIKDACWYYKFRYLIDNNATYFFAFIMSIWSMLYLKLWKRYSAEITYRWGLTGFSLLEEHARPSYESCRSRKRADVIHNTLTNHEEPNVSFWTAKLPCLMLSYSFVLVWIMLVLIFTFCMILYSMFFRSTQFIYGSNKYKEIFFVPVSTAVLSYIVINILNAFYSRFAVWLTESEYQRTQVEFDDSLQLKIYLFQFMNYYCPIFYIAFLKGKFIGTPSQYIRILGMRQEECDLGGCLLEVCIQLAIFMVCEQLWNNFVEYIWPHLITFQRSWREGKKSSCLMCKELLKGICGLKDEGDLPRWLEDIKLNPWDTEIFDEYLEMVIQYGFVTIFATAFPLAPLLALFNNVFIEKHLDAKKFICNYRRPVAQRVPDIGIWFYIMKIIAKISIISNAGIIASTTNLIPLFLYRYDNQGDRKGFLNHSMSYFNVSNIEPQYRPINSTFNNMTVTVCRYPDFKDGNYERTFEYWHVLLAKVVFVLVYQNVVSYIVTIIQWIIPDVPATLRVKTKMEDKHLSVQLLQQYETNIRKSLSMSTLPTRRDSSLRGRSMLSVADIEEEDV